LHRYRTAVAVSSAAKAQRGHRSVRTAVSVATGLSSRAVTKHTVPLFTRCRPVPQLRTRCEYRGCDTGVMWNPDVYLAFADDRGRPFFDLLSRVGAAAPRRVVDLGCGPGNLTVTLAQRWPDAVVEAWDSSPEMVDAARKRSVDAHVGDVRTWTPQPDTDVVVTNATLQWVPEHAELLLRWAGQLAAVASGRSRARPPRPVGRAVAGLPVS
jgi:SAM-dependent methyltransferase